MCIKRNEHADYLVKGALAAPAEEQLQIPIDYANAKQRIKWKSSTEPIPAEVPTMKEDILSARKQK